MQNRRNSISSSPAKFKLHYYKLKKNDSSNIVRTETIDVVDEKSSGCLRNIQTYNPMYNEFFNINEHTWNKIVINNHRHAIVNDPLPVGTPSSSSLADAATASVVDMETKVVQTGVTVFRKYAPLLDPIRYMIGKYSNKEDPDEDLRHVRLPTYTDTVRLKKRGDTPSSSSSPSAAVVARKLNCFQNAAYVDNFFYFLSGTVCYRHHGFLHGLEYFGSFLGIQDVFRINVVDEIEYLHTSSFFRKHLNKKFRVEPNDGSGSSNDDDNDNDDDDDNDVDAGRRVRRSRNNTNVHNKHKRNLMVLDDPAGDILPLLDVESIDEESSSSPPPPPKGPAVDSSNHESAVEEVTVEYTGNINDVDDHDDDDDDDDEDDDDEDSYMSEDEFDDVSGSGDDDNDDEYDSSSSCCYDEDKVMMSIYNFPVQMICLEKCENTLDSLFEKGDMNEAKAASMIFQVIVTLVAYQQMFDFTHNDLHTNNVMFVSTELEFLHYCVDGRWYKVPTYGRLFKIIDFGRAIYRYETKLLCSDSFDTSGDAHTQYNCPPFMNAKQKRIDPNPSFDLCRLASSMYDFVIQQPQHQRGGGGATEEAFLSSPDTDRFQKLVYRWCLDDEGKNVMYKSNGQERYPQFRLYKMIARTVHNHVPRNQLNDPLFASFVIDEAPPAATEGVFNIDQLPVYF